MKLPQSWVDHDLKIRPYQWSHRILGWTQKLLGLLLLAAFLVSMRLVRLEWTLNGWVSSSFLLWLAYFGIIAVVSEVLSLPFSVAHHWVEKSHGLSKQSYGSWAWDRLKGYLVGAILGTIVLGLLYVSVEWGGALWWVWTCTLFVLLSVVLAQLAPVLLIPIFYKLKPMEDLKLKERLLAMSERFGVKVTEVYHLGLGEKTEKGNAAFTGLGKTKRIIIGDTLYEKFSPEEVEAVFAHELGHQVHDDLWKGVILSSVSMYLGFGVTEWVARTWLFPGFETDITRPFGVLIFFLAFSIVQMPLGLVQVLFSRWREREADRFAMEKLGSGKKLAEALEKLTFQNRGQFKPNRISEFFTYSHPAPWRRILRLDASRRDGTPAAI